MISHCLVCFSYAKQGVYSICIKEIFKAICSEVGFQTRIECEVRVTVYRKEKMKTEK